METKQKIEVVVSYGTQQVAFMKKPSGVIKIPFDVLKFNDGSLRVTLDQEVLNSLDHPHMVNIHAYIESLDDLMIVAQIKDVLERYVRFSYSVLTVLSPIYSRYDRVMLGNDGFGTKVFSRFIDSMNFTMVNYFDCHSDVLVKQTNNANDFEQHLLVRDMIDTQGFTIAPDKGACKKNQTAKLMFIKTRDVATGKITGVAIAAYNELKEGVTYTVVDDLCEGGRTFIEVAKEFKNFYENDLQLYVTHGLFTNGAFDKLLMHYTHIYVYFLKESVYNTLSEEQKAQVTIKYLIKDV